MKLKRWRKGLMSYKKFKELIETTDLQKIIYMHCNLKITLTDRQLDKVLKLKRRKEGELWKSKSTII